MAEYIEREAFMEYWNKEFRHLYPNDKYLVALANFPTADVVEVRHGEWVDKGGYFPNCSECDTWTDWSNGTAELNYCPNCGAKMDGKGYNDG